MNIDRKKLAKLLSLTSSDNDHESLSAIRCANDLIKKHKYSWDELLRGVEISLSDLKKMAKLE